MHTLLKPACYFDEKIFAEERQFIFEKKWQFVGLLDELSNHQDFVCTQIAGKSIVIMNFSGTLKAFHNVCSHRFSRILNQDRGTGPLQCQYHGWTYNAEGIPYAIPQRKCFQSIDDINKLKLNECLVDVCGRFVFVNLNSTEETLNDFLGDSKPILLEFSNALGQQIDCNKMDIAANWKIVVENTLEDYHVRVVHPESLYKLGIEERDFNYQGYHSSTTLRFKTKLENNHYVASAYENRPLKILDYNHQIIFPNLTIASAYGTTISIQKIIPVSAKKTTFISTVYGTLENNESAKNKTIYEAFNQSAIYFNHKVFEEDRIICEQAQLGIEESTREYGVLNDIEIRVSAFQKNYLDILEKEKR